MQEHALVFHFQEAKIKKMKMNKSEVLLVLQMVVTFGKLLF